MIEKIKAYTPFNAQEAADKAEILRRLIVGGVMKLKKLFEGNRTRSEVVATFLALLELCRQKSVSLETSGGDETVTFLQMPDD